MENPLEQHDGLTAEDLESLQPWFTVVGVFPETCERWAQPYAAQTPRQAEEFARMDAKEKGGTLWVAGVYEGKASGCGYLCHVR